jgi:hypothetical protein
MSDIEQRQFGALKARSRDAAPHRVARHLADPDDTSCSSGSPASTAAVRRHARLVVTSGARAIRSAYLPPVRRPLRPGSPTFARARTASPMRAQPALHARVVSAARIPLPARPCIDVCRRFDSRHTLGADILRSRLAIIAVPFDLEQAGKACAQTSPSSWRPPTAI